MFRHCSERRMLCRVCCWSRSTPQTDIFSAPSGLCIFLTEPVAFDSCFELRSANCFPIRANSLHLDMWSPREKMWPPCLNWGWIWRRKSHWWLRSFGQRWSLCTFRFFVLCFDPSTSGASLSFTVASRTWFRLELQSWPLTGFPSPRFHERMRVSYW